MSANITKYKLNPESDKKFSAAATLTILFTIVVSIIGGVGIFNAMKHSGNFNGAAIYFGVLAPYFIGCIIVGSGICVCVLGNFYAYLRRVDEESAAATSNDSVTHDDIALTVYSAPMYDIPIYAEYMQQVEPVYTQINPSLTTQLATSPSYSPSYTYTAQSTSQFPMLTPVYIPRYPYTTTT